MKAIATKKLFAFIIMVMFSFSFVNAQDCPGNKIRVYKCARITFGCHSKCGYPNNTWSIYCPCDGRLANEPAGAELFTLAVSPNPVAGSFRRAGACASRAAGDPGSRVRRCLWPGARAAAILENPYDRSRCRLFSRRPFP